MNHYFTISQFARLRGVDINSLRYYERLGILKPAYTDPDTHYRYYDAEQLYMLDTILLCVNLGIPLKQLSTYTDESGNYQNQALFKEGQRRAREKMLELQGSMRCIDRTLKYLEDTDHYKGLSGKYSRVIPRRRIVTAKFTGRITSVDELETAFSELHRSARERQLYPVMPMSLLYLYSRDGLTRRVCWDIADECTADERIVTLPYAEYKCIQVDWNAGLELRPLIEREFDVTGGATVIVSNMGPSRSHSGLRIGEIQVLHEPVKAPGE